MLYFRRFSVKVEKVRQGKEAVSGHTRCEAGDDVNILGNAQRNEESKMTEGDNARCDR